MIILQNNPIKFQVLASWRPKVFDFENVSKTSKNNWNLLTFCILFCSYSTCP